MSLHKELRLFPPPGKWRGQNFSQSYKNCTDESIIVHAHKESVELLPGEEIHIRWDYREVHWKLEPKKEMII